MRTTQIRLINDIEPIGYAKVCQLKQNQQHKDEKIGHLFVILKLSKTFNGFHPRH